MTGTLTVSEPVRGEPSSVQVIWRVELDVGLPLDHRRRDLEGHVVGLLQAERGAVVGAAVVGGVLRIGHRLAAEQWR